MVKEEEEDYPVFYNGKWWSERKCDDIFNCFYHGKNTQREDGAVYAYDGMWVYPDGKIINE